MNILKLCRLCIDIIDALFVVLLSIRNQIVKWVHWYKEKNGIRARDEGREARHIKWIRRVARWVRLPERIAIKVILQVMDSFTAEQILAKGRDTGVLTLFCPDCVINMGTIPSEDHNGERLCPRCHAPLTEPPRRHQASLSSFC